jgi:hypothetical protein
MNAFKHGLASIQKRREESGTTEHEEKMSAAILEGLVGDGACFSQPRNLRVKRAVVLCLTNGPLRDFFTLSFINPIFPKYR